MFCSGWPATVAGRRRDDTLDHRILERCLGDHGQVRRAGRLPRRVEAVHVDEVRGGQPHGLGAGIHHRHEVGLAARHVLGQCDRRIVSRGDQQALAAARATVSCSPGARPMRLPSVSAACCVTTTASSSGTWSTTTSAVISLAVDAGGSPVVDPSRTASGRSPGRDERRGRRDRGHGPAPNERIDVLGRQTHRRIAAVREDGRPEAGAQEHESSREPAAERRATAPTGEQQLSRAETRCASLDARPSLR